MRRTWWHRILEMRWVSFTIDNLGEKSTGPVEDSRRCSNCSPKALSRFFFVGTASFGTHYSVRSSSTKCATAYRISMVHAARLSRTPCQYLVALTLFSPVGVSPLSRVRGGFYLFYVRLGVLQPAYRRRQGQEPSRRRSGGEQVYCRGCRGKGEQRLWVQ